MYLLLFNFILLLNFIFLYLFRGMVIHDNALEKRKIKPTISLKFNHISNRGDSCIFCVWFAVMASMYMVFEKTSSKGKRKYTLFFYKNV